MKKGSWLILIVPNIHNCATSLKKRMRYSNPFADPSHLREYDEEKLKVIITKNGFKIVKVEREDFLIPIVDKLFTF